jgi:hypothetical protein
MKKSSLYIVDYAFLLIGFIPFIFLNGKNDLINFERLSVLSSFVLPFITFGFQDTDGFKKGFSTINILILIVLSVLMIVLINITNIYFFYAPLLAIWGYMRTYNLIVLQNVAFHVILFVLNMSSMLLIYISFKLYLISISLLTLIILLFAYRKAKTYLFTIDLNLVGNQVAQQVVPSIVRFDSSTQLPLLSFSQLITYKLQNIALLSLTHLFAGIRNGQRLGRMGLTSVLVISFLNLIFLPLELFSVFVISISKMLLNLLSARDLNAGKFRLVSFRTYIYSVLLIISFFISSDVNLIAAISIFLLLFFYLHSSWRY